MRRASPGSPRAVRDRSGAPAARRRDRRRPVAAAPPRARPRFGRLPDRGAGAPSRRRTPAGPPAVTRARWRRARPAVGRAAPLRASPRRRGPWRHRGRSATRIGGHAPAAIDAASARLAARAAYTWRCWAANDRCVWSARARAPSASPASSVRRIASRRPPWSSRPELFQTAWASLKACSDSLRRRAVAVACARNSQSSAVILGETSRASIASSRARHSGRSPRMSAFPASSVSTAKAAAVAPRLMNSSRARVRSCSAATVSPRSASRPPRLRSSCASQNTSPRSRRMARARSVSVSGSVVMPAYQSTAIRKTSERARSCGSSAAYASSSSRMAALIAPRPARSRASRRRASAVRSGQAVTLTGPDGAADRADRSRVAELMLGEAQRVQRRDFGFRVSLPAGVPKSTLGEGRRRGGVRLDQLEGRLRELERIVLDGDRHRATCIKKLSEFSECS